jgi:hypothetical protein
MSIPPESEPSLSDRLGRLDGLNKEFIRKASSLIKSGDAFFVCDMFIFGAIRRTQAQISGFKMMIEAHNFPCAAALVRMQLDTAMRVHALTLVSDPDKFCTAALEGARLSAFKDKNGKRLTDRHLLSEIAKQEPWVAEVYEQVSGFIHLSARHFYIAIHGIDDGSRRVFFELSDVDPPRPESTYYEVVDAFYHVTKLASLQILGYLVAHRR